GKPEDEDDAFRMLTSLSDKSHHVFTGICVYSSETNQQFLEYEKTKVTFSAISENEIRDYIRSGSPLDKAGSYGIQDDYGAVFISKIDGCFYNVVGLPLNRLYKILMRIGN
ncbi:MAG: Maf family protein, partial [Melioribacteraceae bacterium]|nr:Maf family protein [Melioribacteraceae bacterium]